MELIITKRMITHMSVLLLQRELRTGLLQVVLMFFSSSKVLKEACIGEVYTMPTTLTKLQTADERDVRAYTVKTVIPSGDAEILDKACWYIPGTVQLYYCR